MLNENKKYNIASNGTGKEYLPSKKFLQKVIIVAGFLVVLFALYKVIPILSNKFKQAKKNYEMKKVTVKDLVEKDSNENGIPDWEESLWGLDPNGDGKENLAFILEKRKALGYSENLNNGELTTNDKMARELLVLIVTLRDSGNLNEGSLDAISQAVGEKIQIQEIADVYNKENLITTNTNPATIEKYYNDFKSINDKYQDQDIGNELTFISQAIQNNDQQAMNVAKMVATAYREYGKDLLLIKVPTSLVATHLAIVNDYEKVAQSIEKMDSSLVDQLAGMSALVTYKKYSDELASNLEKLQTFFQRNDIIQ